MYIRRNIESLIVLIAFGGIVGFYYFGKIDDKMFLGLIGAVATLYFGVLKYKVENDNIFKELFKEFNSRYDEEFNDLINRIKEDEAQKLTIDERNLIRDYLNLCAEEYLWATKGRIPKEVWKAWKAGIKDNLKIKQVNEVFQSETKSNYGRDSYYGLVEELET
jgi:hypothetical protein